MIKLVLPILLASLTVGVRSEAFSYSSGWRPGQTVTSQSSTPTGSHNGGTPSSRQLGWGSKLTSGLMGGLFARSGINITERLEEARRKAAELPWDNRITMISDDNFEELIINEKFATQEEEESQLWFLLVTVSGSQRGGISILVDKQFDEAYNISVNEQDLPNVHWGRIDYLNVTRLTTKWAVWRAPTLIVAKDNGRTLRFFYPQQIGVSASELRQFLLQEGWQRRAPWSGPWAPGGSREKFLDKIAVFQEHLYFYMIKIPRWMYLILSGGIGSVIVQLLHRKPKSATGQGTQRIQPIPTEPPVEQPKDEKRKQTSPSAAEMKEAGFYKRKGGNNNKPR